MACNQSEEQQLVFHSPKAEDLLHYAAFYGLRRNKTSDSAPLKSFLWKDYFHARAALICREGQEIGLVWLYEENGEPFASMPYCTEADLPCCFERIQKYFNEVLQKPLLIQLADEEAVTALRLQPEHYLIREDEEARDYLYDAEALRTLAGKKLHKKKNHCNSFERTFQGRYEYRSLTPQYRDQIFRFLDFWREKKSVEVEEHLDPEVEGIHKILKNLETLRRIRMGAVFIDGNLEAFSMACYNSLENMAIIHIEKANPEINGLYQMINREVLRHEFPEAALVNREDDMGLEGLRRSKLSYYPVGYARKYRVQQKL